MAKTILIVEDEITLAEVFELKFKKAGYNVLVAHDGSEGLKIATSKLPDLILLDILMPVMGGFEVLKKLRDNEETRDLIIYILSNLGDDEEIQKGMRLGADRYMIKANITPNETLGIVREALGD